MEAIGKTCKPAEDIELNANETNIELEIDEIPDMDDMDDIGEPRYLEAVNIFKYEIVKMCIERVLGDMTEEDENDRLLNKDNKSISYNIAYNTLHMYGIIKQIK